MSKTDHRKAQHRVLRSPEENRALILDAARAVWGHEGYNEASVQDIVDAIGYTKPFLYYYFPSKEHVLLALAEDSPDFEEACRKLGAGAGTIRRVRALRRGACAEQSA